MDVKELSELKYLLRRLSEEHYIDTLFLRNKIDKLGEGE